jgi:putative tryptophan/tyrosine transport system substrate-binding protein
VPVRLVGLAVVLSLGLTLAPLAAGAQQTAKVPRIGVLVPRIGVLVPAEPESPNEPNVAAFRGGSGEALFFPHRSRIPELVAKHKLPASYEFRVFVEAGGLMSYGYSLADLWRRAATYTDKILKGAKPADLPIEQPTKFELVINLKTAKALGLTIPQTLLLRADEVIK